MRLANKVALITGGGTGIGRATAELFAKEGAKVAVSGIPAEKLEEVVHTITARGGEAIAIPGDVTDEEAAKQMVRTPIARWKYLNVLVNNAGVIRRKELHETTLKDWDYMMDTNVKGIYLVSKNALPELIKDGGGSDKVRSRISGAGSGIRGAKTGEEGRGINSEELGSPNPKINEVAVIGVPDKKRGENVKAFVVLKEGESTTAEEIIRWSKEHMAAYKYPRIIEFRDDLPKTPLGKVLRKALKAEENQN